MAEGHSSKQAREQYEAAERIQNAAIPLPEQGTRAKSPAAHLEAEGDVTLLPYGNGKQGREPGSQSEPPQDPKKGENAVHRRG